jgi:hypothetical protein
MIPTHIGREDPQRRSARRHRRSRAAVIPAILAWAVLGAVTVAAQAPSSRSDPAPVFTPVDPATLSAPIRPPSAAPEDRADAPLDADAAIGDFVPRALGAEAQRDAYGQPDIDTKANVKAQSKLPPTKVRARGSATWFCLAGVSSCHYARSGGMYAAAGAELRKGDWRGRTVTVCAGSDCIRVTLIDWCACKGNRVIDLYGDAFRRLAPLGAGVIPVSVRW